MRESFIIFVGALLSGLGFAVSASAQEVLKRSGNWDISYDINQCVLSASFGDGEEALELKFIRREPSSNFQLMVVGKRYRGIRREKDLATVDFGLEPSTRAAVEYGRIDGAPMMLIRSGVLHAKPLPSGAVVISTKPEEEARITSLNLTVPRMAPVRLEFGSFGKPYAALRTCVADLIESWGYDPASIANIVQRAAPKSPPQSWIMDADFPLKALNEGLQGSVDFRLDVDANGAAKGCSILSISNSSEFAKLTCDKLLKAARFTPAIDKSGAQVPSYFMSTVIWQIDRNP